MLLFTKCKSSKFFNTLSQKTYFFKIFFDALFILLKINCLKKITLKKKLKKIILSFCI